MNTMKHTMQTYIYEGSVHRTLFRVVLACVFVLAPLLFGYSASAAALTLSGTLYRDEGTTALTGGAAAQIRIAISTSTVSFHSSTTVTSSGAWTITIPDGHTITAGTPILVYSNGDSTRRGAVFTKAAGTSDITGLHIYRDRFIIRNEATNGATLLSDMTYYDGDDDGDIQYRANGNTLTVNTNQRVYIWPNTQFHATGTVTVRGNASTSPTDGSFHIASGATYSMSGTTTLAGSFTASSTATYSRGTSGTSTIEFNATTTGKYILAPIASVGRLSFNSSSGGWTFATSATTTDLDILAGTVTGASGNVVVSKYFTNNGTFTAGSGTTTLSGRGMTVSGTLTGSSALGHVAITGEGTAGEDEWVVAKSSGSNHTRGGFVDDTVLGRLWAGDQGNLSWCNATTLCDSGGDWNSLMTATAYVFEDMVIDKVNRVLFVATAGTPQALLRCELSTGCDDSSEFTTATTSGRGGGSGGYKALAIDTSNNVLYITEPQHFSDFTHYIWRCALSTGCDAAEDFTATFATSTWEIPDIEFDPINGVLYTMSWNSHNLFRCAVSTGCDANSEWTLAHATSGLGSSQESIVVDTGNNVLYVGISQYGSPSRAVIARCALSTGCDQATDFTVSFDAQDQLVNGSLNGELSGVAYDHVHKILYATLASSSNPNSAEGGGVIFRCTTSTGCDASSDWVLSRDIYRVASLQYPYYAETVDAVYTGNAYSNVLGEFNSGNWHRLGTPGITFMANASTSNLTIGSGAGLTAPSHLSIAGHYNNQGAYTASSSGTTTFSGTSAQTASGTMTGTSAFVNLAFTGAGTKTFSTNASSTGNFTIHSGSGAVVAPSQLSIAGNYANSGTFTGGSGTTTFTGSTTQTLSGTLSGSSAFGNVVFTGIGAKTISSQASTTNFFIGAATNTVPAGTSTLMFSAYECCLDVSTFIDAVTITPTASSGPILNSGFESPSVPSSYQYNPSGASWAFHPGSGVQGNGSAWGASTAPEGTQTAFLQSTADVSQAVKLDPGTYTLSFYTARRTGQVNEITVTIGGVPILSEFTPAGNSFELVTVPFTVGPRVTAPSTNLSIGGHYRNGGMFIHNSGTTTFSGTSAQTATGTMTGASAFNNLVFTGAGTKTFNANASTTHFTILSGSGAVSAPPRLSLTGNFSNSGTFTAGLGTTTFNGTSAQVATGTLTSSSAFNSIEIANTSATTTFGASFTANGHFRTATATPALIFASGGTTTLNTAFIVGSSTVPLRLRTTTDGRQNYLDINGSYAVLYVDVKDSNACPTASNLVAATATDSGNNNCWGFGGVESAADQTFSYGQATTSISMITVSDKTSPVITATNDIRIKIATSTVGMRWDTTDTTATLGGTASAKVSTTVSYEGNGSVLVLNVTSNFSSGDTLTISDLSFAQFTGTTTATSALAVYLGGASDTSVDFRDTKTVTITGSLTLAEHASGQVSDAFAELNANDVELYRFKFTPQGETITISQVILSLRGVNGVISSDVSSVRLYQDTNSNGVYDATDTQVGGSPSVSMSGQSGTITWSTSFQSTTTRNYVIVANLSNIRGGDMMTTELYTTGVTATGNQLGLQLTLGGAASGVQHIKNGSLGAGTGGGGAIGGEPPAGQGIQGGGSNQGGGIVDTDTGGTSLGDMPDYNAPTANGTPQSGWTTGGSGYNSDGNYATAASAGLRHTFSTFGFSVPSNNTVTGIEVKIEAAGTTAAGTIDVKLSWNGGSSLTSAKNTGTLTATDAVYTLGGPSELWGRSWSTSEFANGSFAIEVIGNPSSNTVKIDAIRVNVYHQAGGATGGGGGGEVYLPIPLRYASAYTGNGRLVIPLSDLLAAIRGALVVL